MHAAARDLDIIARASIKIAWTAGMVLDAVPIRSVFRKADGPGKRRLVKRLSGAVLTRDLLGLGEARCPACGQLDTMVHRLFHCWVSAPVDVPWLAWMDVLEPQLGLPYFAWTENRPDVTRFVYFMDEIRSDKFEFNAADGDIY